MCDEESVEGVCVMKKVGKCMRDAESGKVYA